MNPTEARIANSRLSYQFGARAARAERRARSPARQTTPKRTQRAPQRQNRSPPRTQQIVPEELVDHVFTGKHLFLVIIFLILVYFTSSIRSVADSIPTLKIPTLFPTAEQKALTTFTETERDVITGMAVSLAQQHSPLGSLFNSVTSIFRPDPYISEQAEQYKEKLQIEMESINSMKSCSLQTEMDHLEPVVESESLILEKELSQNKHHRKALSVLQNFAAVTDHLKEGVTVNLSCLLPFFMYMRLIATREISKMVNNDNAFLHQITSNPQEFIKEYIRTGKFEDQDMNKLLSSINKHVSETD